MLIVVMVSTIILVGFSRPVLAETSYFPIPAISSSKNDGRDIGLIVPILESDEEGNLKSLMAPMVIHNSFLGTRATFKKSNEWHVYDVVIDGVSLVKNFRGQFDRIIKSSGYEGLFKKLRRKTQSTSPS